MHSLRVKITSVTVLAILTSVLSVFLVYNFTVQIRTDRSTAEILSLVGQNTKDSVEQYLGSIEQSVETAAKIAYDGLDCVILVENGAVGSFAGQEGQTPEQAAAVEAYMREYCADFENSFASIAGHTPGIITYYYCINPEICDTVHGFFYSRVGKTGFDEQEPLDARELDPADIEHTTWYYTPIERGRPSWVGPYTAHFLNELWTYSYLVPIYKAGALIGVLGLDIPIEEVTTLISAIRVYEEGYACLFDEEGRVMYHPKYDFGAVPEDLSIVDTAGVFRAKDSGAEPIRYTLEGEARQMVFFTLSNGMKLVITVPERELTDPWNRLVKISLIVSLVLILVFSLFILFMVGLITRPLQGLTAASRRLADGDYEVELSYKGRDEVGALTGAFVQMRDHIRFYIQDLNRRVNTDDLTGLPNMRCFFRLAEEERLRLLAEGKQPVFFYINLIGMKFYNRQHGFAQGDALIKAFANILRSRFGERCVGHFAQDHFAAISAESDMQQTLEDIFRECAKANGGNSLPLRVGVYCNSMEEVRTSTACDRAKYACDRLRGSYVSGYRIFDAAMLRSVLNSRYIIQHLDQAIAEGWIQVYYQPIIRTANERICDEEALSRWFDPERGYLSPADFIPVLEDARLIYRLDLFVLEQVLEKMRAQREEGLEVVPHSVNLSRVDFDACDIVEEVCRRVDAAGIPREKLTIEITESTLAENFEFMKLQIERFQTLGFRVWMDDFGSGYSALDVLQDIHFDLIKFDMCFLRNFDRSSESRIILTELMKMSIGLGIDTVAEGVETKEQVAFLREVGCTKLQGFFFSKPISKEEIRTRSQEGRQIGYENLAEADYYTAIGRINLYDLSTLGDGERIGNFFETLPMAVVESDGQRVNILRCNKSYRDFLRRSFKVPALGRELEFKELENGPGTPFAEAMRQCREAGSRVFIHEPLLGDSTIHALLRHVAINPVTGVYACVVVILGVDSAGPAA